MQEFKTRFNVFASLKGKGGFYELGEYIARDSNTALRRAKKDYNDQYENFSIKKIATLTRSDYYRENQHYQCTDWSKL